MSDAPPLLLDFEIQGRITVATIRASSVLSPLNVVEFGNRVLAHVKEHPKLNLLLNFEKVDYLSSSVLTELLRIHKAIEETRGTLRLCAVSPVIREVFEITNLDSVFVINTENAAVCVKRFERALDVAAEDEAWQEPKSS